MWHHRLATLGLFTITPYKCVFVSILRWSIRQVRVVDALIQHKCGILSANNAPVQQIPTWSATNVQHVGLTRSSHRVVLSVSVFLGSQLPLLECTVRLFASVKVHGIYRQVLVCVLILPWLMIAILVVCVR